MFFSPCIITLWLFFRFYLSSSNRTSSTNNEGRYICRGIRLTFFCTWGFFSLLAGGRFSCSQPRGTQEARVYTRRKCAVHGACSVGSKSRTSSNYRICFRRAHASPDNVNPTVEYFDRFALLLYYTILPALKFRTLRQPRYNSSSTSSSSICDGDRPCFCVCVYARLPVM